MGVQEGLSVSKDGSVSTTTKLTLPGLRPVPAVGSTPGETGQVFVRNDSGSDAVPTCPYIYARYKKGGRASAPGIS